MSLLRRAACAAFELPQRAQPLKAKKPAIKKSVKKDGGGLPKHLTRYLPFVPSTLVHETTSFLHDASKLRSLLSLIFSPCKPEATAADHHTDFYRRHESAAAASMWQAIEALPADLYEEAIQSVTFAPPYVNEPPPPDPQDIRTFPGKDDAGNGGGTRGASTGRSGATAAARAANAAGASEGEDGSAQAAEKDFFVERFAFPRALMFHEMYGQQIFQSLTQLERRKLQVFMNLMHVRYPHAELKRDKPALFWLPERQVLSRQREGAYKRKAAK
ncbi:hypothetical protein BESB_049110 [Besnoitia besnoiti]|uniref:Uncharacterized protein n=1 Tax=Besnoitia besnoiti TaxID=94643 RepID=A0A2A9MFL6_BESBE|nr:hypothetical protein BESB_049110 [Besnoitia besnoiti]PFH36719.1 hypothetical protein BESB_049110 [Besnoitia besnoiti]